MKKVLIGGVVAVVIVMVALWIYNSNVKKPVSGPVDGIRIGWQTPWATQGQLTQVLKHTDILKNNNLTVEFKGFDSGAPLNEAALGNSVDVIFTADQPAATLLAKNPDWVIIGRLMYNRVSLYVPPKSPIQNVSDLKGKKVAMPFGAAAQRMALKAEKDAGLDPTKDVQNVNLGIYEQAALVRDASATKWGDVDAMAGFDPTPAIFQEKGLVRNLHTENVISVIVMSKKYIAEHSEAPVNFLASMRDSYDYYRNNVDQADDWFVQDAKMDISHTALATSAAVEPNLTVKNKTDIRLSFNDDDYRIMQEAADFIFNQKLVTKQVNMKDFVDLSYLDKIK